MNDDSQRENGPKLLKLMIPPKTWKTQFHLHISWGSLSKGFPLFALFPLSNTNFLVLTVLIWDVLLNIQIVQAWVMILCIYLFYLPYKHQPKVFGSSKNIYYSKDPGLTNAACLFWTYSYTLHWCLQAGFDWCKSAGLYIYNLDCPMFPSLPKSSPPGLGWCRVAKRYQTQLKVFWGS